MSFTWSGLYRVAVTVFGASVAGVSWAQAPAAGEPAFRALYKELVEINTTRSVGSCTKAAEAMRARLLADKLENRAAALAAIRAAFQDPANDDTSHSFLIYNYADHFGDRDLALAALRRAYDRGSYDYYNLWFPSESGFRSDPKFKAMMRDFGLVDYWRSTGNWGDFCKPVGSDDFECH